MWQGKHRGTLTELNTALNSSRLHASLAEEYKNDLESTRLQLEDEKAKHKDLQAQASKLRSELAAGHSDVEQLKSLVLASNRSQADLESRISSQASQLRHLKSNLEQAEDKLKLKEEELQEVQQQLEQSKHVVRQLDCARDQLQVLLTALSAILADQIAQHHISLSHDDVSGSIML